MAGSYRLAMTEATLRQSIWAIQRVGIGQALIPVCLPIVSRMDLTVWNHWMWDHALPLRIAETSCRVTPNSRANSEPLLWSTLSRIYLTALSDNFEWALCSPCRIECSTVLNFLTAIDTASCKLIVILSDTLYKEQQGISKCYLMRDGLIIYNYHPTIENEH